MIENIALHNYLICLVSVGVKMLILESVLEFWQSKSLQTGTQNIIKKLCTKFIKQLHQIEGDQR